LLVITLSSGFVRIGRHHGSGIAPYYIEPFLFGEEFFSSCFYGLEVGEIEKQVVDGAGSGFHLLGWVRRRCEDGGNGFLSGGFDAGGYVDAAIKVIECFGYLEAYSC
jgi:hypothetical protein